ncbi:pentatricopeptide repeat-containing protein At2g45350, chloroplastic [Mercurialis annua]|uniref:pentatricopeptide repeat-containing protein At2g45350, chloroplastic n=1 Tax=Mercurialis annua TaxID=3986 RepID=UPI00216098A2|nr:pentatricopeptide repeat-containing protein At2g45350, chloroplastic [Mercurialis annua]
MLLSANSITNQQPWNSTLLLLQKCKTSNEINQIHARLIKTGFINNTYLTTKIILSLSSSPYLPLNEFSRYIFFTHHAHRISAEKNEDPFLWNAVIKSYSHGNDPKQAFKIFILMLENGIRVDKFSISLVLKACSRLGLVKEGLQVHGLLRKLEFGSDLFLQNCLIALYIRCKCIGNARQVFDKMRRRDSVSYNSMIDGYVKLGKVDIAGELFDLMPMEMRNLISWNCLISGYMYLDNGFERAWEVFEKMPERDLITWNSMIDVCAKCGRIEEARALFDRMPERDIISWANMIDAYAKLGHVDTARRFFCDMPVRDVIVCNSLMSGYVQNGYCLEALDLFHYMQSVRHLSPNNVTLLIVLSAIAQLGNIEKVISLHCYLEDRGFSLEGKLGVALIDAYSKCGSIEDSILLFEGIKEKTVDHWNAMISGLATHGLGELALRCLVEMERMRVKPDNITFIGLLNACDHGGLVKEGMICFELMRRVYKVEPKLQHYGCMVGILSRAGHIIEARNFVDEMPIEPNDVIWRTLVTACKGHESFSIGEPLAQRLLKLDASNSSSYVLLAKLYAGVHLWNDANRIRTMMKERNLTKIPGCSWIELDGITHAFSVQDYSHPQVTEIYSLIVPE